MPPAFPITDPVCICAENTLYFHVKSQEPRMRVYVAECEFWQDAASLL